MNANMKVIRELLVQQIEAIDAGNSNISEDAQLAILETFARACNPQEKISKAKAISYINKCGIKMCRATFDNYVKCGKIPAPRHELGFNPKF